MEKNIFFPDYKNSILALSNSLLKKYGVKTKHPSLKSLDQKIKPYKNVILMIFDGLGMNILNQHLKENDFLRKHLFQELSSVYPPTTVAATTSIHSGLAPIEHGWIGWMQYFKEYDRVIELFRNTDFYSAEKVVNGPLIAEQVLAYKDIYTQIVEKNKEVHFTKIYPSWAENGVSSLNEMNDRIINALKTNEKNIILAYWTEPDHSIHRQGVQSQIAHNLVQEINKSVENLFSQISNDTIILITADHGIVDADEIFLNDIEGFSECFKNPPSMEVRLASFFIKEDKREQFLTLFNRHFKEDFILYTHNEYISSGLLGKGNMHPKIEDFVGDYVAISHGKRAICYYTDKEKAICLKADHAGITKEEMLVPLIILERK